MPRNGSRRLPRGRISWFNPFARFSESNFWMPTGHLAGGHVRLAEAVLYPRNISLGAPAAKSCNRQSGLSRVLNSVVAKPTRDGLQRTAYQTSR